MSAAAVAAPAVKEARAEARTLAPGPSIDNSQVAVEARAQARSSAFAEDTPAPGFESPAFKRVEANLPAARFDIGSYALSKEYRIKEGNQGILKHVMKIWSEGVVTPGSDSRINITRVYQYLSSPQMMNDYQSYFNEAERKGYGLETAAKKLQTVQAWYVPTTRESLERILRDGFFGVGAIAFCKDPVMAVDQNAGGMQTLILTRVLLAQYTEQHGKYCMAHGKGCMPAFLVEYTIGGKAVNASE